MELLTLVTTLSAFLATDQPRPDPCLTKPRPPIVLPRIRTTSKSWFPLAVGNKWVYENGTETECLTVLEKSGSWYGVTNLAGKTRWARMKGVFSKPTLEAYPNRWGRIQDLFDFERAEGHIYKTDFDPLLSEATLMVGAADEIVVTPIATFVGCLRLDVLESSSQFNGYRRLWFAPGVGLVKYMKGPSFWALQKTFVLVEAHVQEDYPLIDPPLTPSPQPLWAGNL